MSQDFFTIKRYASSLLLSKLAREPDLPENPSGESFPAATLFADITGFTALTEKIAKESGGGVQKLARILDLYIGKLVEIIHEHGGDIVKFAGDALFAVWPVDKEEGLPLKAHRAVQCGLVIQKRLHQMQVEEDVTLSLRVGLGAGTMHALYVGGLFERWELLIAGDPMNQVSEAGKIANPGEVVISAQVGREMARIEGGKRKGANRFVWKQLPATHSPQKLAEVNITDASERALRSFIPRAILSRLDEGLDTWSADLRRVTVLFLKVRNFQYNADTPVDNIQKLMALMQDCLYKHEGSINRFGIDDKGAILLAAFGLPPLNHDEDDPLHALRAAKHVRAELQKIGKGCAIGIATGRAFCGSVGNDTRCEYTMHGTNVNLAARLMQNAETVLCDGNTYEAAKHEIDFEELPALKVKGRQEPVKVYRPTE